MYKQISTVSILCKKIRRKMINWTHKDRISLGYDTSLTLRNFVVSCGTIEIGDGVEARTGTVFTVDSGGAIEIGDHVFFNRNCIIASHKQITICSNSIFGPNVCIYDHNHRFSKAEGIKKHDFSCDSVSIGEGCWIGANVVILKGTHLGKNCVVGAGTILSGYYEDNTVIRSKTEIIQEIMH